MPTDRSQISGNTRGKMEQHFPIKLGQPTGMILAIFNAFSESPY